MSKYDDQLDRMLARGRLTPNELDAVLERAIAPPSNVAQKAEAPRKLWWRWALVPTLSFGVVTCMFLILANPFTTEEFRARGAGTAVALSAECGSPCMIGSPVVFRIGAHARAGYLAAYAVTEGARVWYYPTAAAGSPLIAASEQDGASASAAVIGDEQQPGRYVVHVLLLTEPLTKETIATLAHDDARVIAHSQNPLTVESRK